MRNIKLEEIGLPDNLLSNSDIRLLLHVFLVDENKIKQFSFRSQVGWTVIPPAFLLSLAYHFQKKYCN